MHALDALGNPLRRQILVELRAGPRSVGELTSRFPVSRPAVSRHLRVLREAGLVEQRDGAEGRYAVRLQGFRAVHEFLDDFWDTAVSEPGPSVERSVWLACGADAAFRLFTERISSWWPPERRHTGDPASVLLLDPQHFVERASDGREVPLGRVRAWEPPDRVLLDFFPGTDADHPTAVEVRFVPEGDGTRVVVHHTPTEASRALWSERAPRYVRSWELCLVALELANR